MSFKSTAMRMWGTPLSVAASPSLHSSSYRVPYEKWTPILWALSSSSTPSTKGLMIFLFLERVNLPVAACPSLSPSCMLQTCHARHTVHGSGGSRGGAKQGAGWRGRVERPSGEAEWRGRVERPGGEGPGGKGPVERGRVERGVWRGRWAHLRLDLELVSNTDGSTVGLG